MKPVRLSVVVSAYNRPRYLDLALRGFARQRDRNFEILVADDGSTPEVAAVISRVRAETGLPVVHVWHEDRGFRKTVILNRAILAARGDYLLFTDGDCVPRHDLVASHRRLARPGRYLSGGYLKLPQELSDRIDVADVEAGRVSDLAWLRANGWRPGLKALRLTPSPTRARLYDRVTTTRAHFNGNNSSAWRADVLAVNGFDNDMGYGSEDRMLGVRLANAGVCGVQVRHRAVTMHLEHPRPYGLDEVARSNGARVRRAQRSGLSRAADGIAELPDDPTLRIDRPE